MAPCEPESKRARAVAELLWSRPELVRYHADFYGASNAELAMVGDFDAKEVEKLVTELFGSWPSKSPYERVAAVFLKNVGDLEVIDTPDKEGGFIVTVQSFEMRDDNPDYPALVLANYLLGGGGAGRLNNRLRQKEGWSYGAFSQIFASPIDTFGLFFGGALVNPANAPKAMAALLEEIGLVIEKGAPADELAAAKQGLAGEAANELADDGQVVDKLVTGLYLGRTLAWDQALNDKIAALTGADLSAVLTKGHLKVATFGSVLAADQTKAADK